MLLGDGYNFLGTHFWRGQDFWTVNLRGAKILNFWTLTFEIYNTSPFRQDSVGNRDKVYSKFFKLSLSLSFTHVRAQIAFMN